VRSHVRGSRKGVVLNHSIGHARPLHCRAATPGGHKARRARRASGVTGMKPTRRTRRWAPAPVAFLCPHCGAETGVRTSSRITPTLRKADLLCTNPQCGHAFVVHAEAVRTLSPSARPNPAIYLPMSVEVRDAMAQHATMSDPEGRNQPPAPWPPLPKPEHHRARFL